MANAPRLEVVKQTALQEDRATKNGVTMSVYVVVKNSPFQLVLGLKGNKVTQNFNQLAFDMKLLYDMETEKEVAFLKTKPIDYKPAINDVGDQITFDVKIKVLSSHHEDNFFRLKTIVWDPVNPDFQLMTFSYPIKVISKPLKHRKAATGSPGANGKLDADGEPIAPTKQLKRSFTERDTGPSLHDFDDVSFLHSKISELIEEQQQTRDEVRLMRQLVQQQHQQQQQISIAAHLQNMANSATTTTMAPDMDFLPPPAKKVKQEEISDVDRDIEGLMSRLLTVYSVMEFEDKNERVRSLLRNMSARDAEQLVELIDLLNAHGLQHEAQKSMYGMGQPFTMAGTITTVTGPGSIPPPNTMPHTHVHGHPNGLPCGSDCPHKVELSRMDQFYNEVFF